MSGDTKFTYNATPYNFQDQGKNPNINRGGYLPSFRYKNSRIVWLNSAFRSSSASIVDGTTHYEHVWDIPSFQLFNRTKLSVVSYTSNESSAKPIIMKLKGLLYDTDSTFNSDNEAFPTLYVSHTGVASNLNNNQFSLLLPPQVVSQIRIALSNNFSTRNAGFTISGGGSGNYIIGLLFEDDDLIIDDASSIYK